jgi:hypothetical protein
MIGGIKVERIQKTKFRKHNEQEEKHSFQSKKKHQDKATYRMIREEDDEFDIYTKTNKTT